MDNSTEPVTVVLHTVIQEPVFVVSREMCEDLFSFLRNLHFQEQEMFLCVRVRAHATFPYSAKYLSYVCSKSPHKTSPHKILVGIC